MIIKIEEKRDGPVPGLMSAGIPRWIPVDGTDSIMLLSHQVEASI